MSRLLLYRLRRKSNKIPVCCICDRYKIPCQHFHPWEIELFHEKYELILCGTCNNIENICNRIKKLYLPEGRLSIEIAHLVEYCCMLDLIDLLHQIIMYYPAKLEIRPCDTKSCVRIEYKIDMKKVYSDEYDIIDQFKISVELHGSINILRGLSSKLPKFTGKVLDAIAIRLMCCTNIHKKYFSTMNIVSCSMDYLGRMTNYAGFDYDHDSYILLCDSTVRR